MSRNIPRCRAWRVRYHMCDGTRRDVFTFAPNKRFARWNARDHALQTWRDNWAVNVERVSVSRVEA
jgi:hypothetical protein